MQYEFPIEPWPEGNIWLAECPMCMVVLGAEEEREVAERVSEHIVFAHEDEIMEHF